MQAEGLKGWQCFWLAFLGLDGPWVERVDGLPSWGLNCFAFSGVSSFGPVFMTVGYLKSLVVLFALKLAQWGTDAPLLVSQTQAPPLSSRPFWFPLLPPAFQIHPCLGGLGPVLLQNAVS